MLKKLLRRYAERHVPTVHENKYFRWRLFDFGPLRIYLWAWTKSCVKREEVFNVRDRHNWLLLVDGEARLHYEHDFADPLPPESYRFVRQDVWFVARLFSQGEIAYFRGGEQFEVDLAAARTYAEKIFDMPEWMTPNDVLFDTERQAWVLDIGWGRRRG